MNATTKVAYDPSNFPALAPIREEAVKTLNAPKGGAKTLQDALQKLGKNGADLTADLQVAKPPGGNALRTFTLGELADSAENEVVGQAVDPKAVNEILFGRYGLIRKTGGGRTDKLMEDIEVAYIKDFALGTTIGPIITSGRHRTLALQIMLEAAGIALYRDFTIRCSVINLNNQQQLQDRIISANIGSRTFDRAEIRERQGSTGAVILSSCEKIEATILQAENSSELKAAFASYLKLLATELQLNTFRPSQYADAGNNLWSQLEKLRPEGGTFAKWIKADLESRFRQVMSAARDGLPTAVNQALHNPAGGAKSSKIAKALAPMVAAKCFR